MTHRIDDGWCPYVHALVVGKVTDSVAMRSLLAWGWDFRVAKSLTVAMVAKGEVVKG